MGIYMPNIEKPKQCAGCQFEVIDTTGYPRCVVMRKMVVDGNLFNRCPLVEIPTPHGRLIDADELRVECYHTMDELMKSTTINISAEASSLLCGFTMIGEAPTILEAEE